MWGLWNFTTHVFKSVWMKFLDLKRNIYAAFYDFHIDNTHEMYKMMLDRIPNGAKILEVGIGNGTCIDKNAELIKDKKLHIDGIDIDEEYLEVCNLKITANGLNDQVTARKQDLIVLDETVYGKFDYIFFMESFPVIPTPIMKRMISNCRNLLNAGGKLVFVHNLVVKKNPVHAFFKPKLINIPFVWVDFGKLTSHDEWDVFCKECNIIQDKKECIMKVDLSEKYALVPKPLSFNMEQFGIICSFDESAPVAK